MDFHGLATVAVGTDYMTSTQANRSPFSMGKFAPRFLDMTTRSHRRRRTPHPVRTVSIRLE
jgi:hypothetical protein